MFVGFLPEAKAQQGISVQNAVIKQYQNSLQFPAGSDMYLYCMDSGGASASQFSNGEYAYATTNNGNIGASLALTTNNQNSYSYSGSYYSIGGIGVSGFSNYVATFAANNQPGASSASVQFSLTTNALVVFIALASSQQYLTLNGIPNLIVDAASGNGSGISVAIVAHAYLGSGSYTVSESSAATSEGQDPNNMVDLLGVFEFTSSDSSQDFKLEVSPVTQSVPITGIATFSVQIASINGFGGDVSLTTSNLPAGFQQLLFNPNPIQAYTTSLQISYLSVNVSSIVQVGQSYYFYVIATCGSLSHSQKVTIYVTQTVGLRNILFVSSINQPEDEQSFTIQQNFVVLAVYPSGTVSRFWAQNALYVKKTLGEYRMAADYQIFPFDSSLPPNPGWCNPDPSGLINVYVLTGPVINFPATFDFTSVLSGNQLTFTNNCGDWSWPIPEHEGQAPATVFICNNPVNGYNLNNGPVLGAGSPEFVIVGPPNGGSANFATQTVGSIESYAEVSGHLPSSLLVSNVATAGSTLTKETAYGLKMSINSINMASFSDLVGENDEGVFFAPQAISSVVGGVAGEVHGLVSVRISGSSASDGTAVDISTIQLSNLPEGVPSVNLANEAYYDVRVDGISDGMATVSIANTQGQTAIYFWNGLRWIQANDVTFSGNTITGDIPVASLSGTPIALASLTLDFSLKAGWNMVSFPILPDDTSFASIFSGKGFYQVLTWTGTNYVTAANVEAGKGYWILVLADTTITISGNPVTTYQVDLPAGWSMIGSTNSVVNCQSVFSGYYQMLTWSGTSYITSTTIEPGKGYWALVLTPTHIAVG